MNRQNQRAIERKMLKKNMTKAERREFSRLSTEVKDLVAANMLKQIYENIEHEIQEFKAKRKL